MPEKRLYRSQSHKMIAGVCGGVAEYLNVDPTVVRIAWILLSVLPFIPGIILYIIAWIVIPKHPSETSAGSPGSSVSSTAFFGFFFIAAGIVLLLGNLNFFGWGDWWHFSWEYGLPLILIGAGVLLLVRPRIHDATRAEKTRSSAKRASVSSAKTLRRSRSERKILGVCGGIAAYFDVDPSLVRIAFVFFSLWPFGLGVVLYLLMALIIPDENTSPQPGV